MNRVYRALADPTRRRVLALLRERDMTAGELAAQFDLSWPTMSGHFAVLREADLVSSDREGSTIRYHLNASVLEEAMLALMDALRIDPARNRAETRSKRLVRSSAPNQPARPRETR
jgi:ArsR family transcriptional regulator, arsenate/arsenite/antimonite-responsive transcriptional repressor